MGVGRFGSDKATSLDQQETPITGSTTGDGELDRFMFYGPDNYVKDDLDYGGC